MSRSKIASMTARIELVIEDYIQPGMAGERSRRRSVRETLGGGEPRDEHRSAARGTAQALGMLRSALGYLAAADATAMAAETQALCLQALEQATAIGTAARASILAAFTSGKGYCADADYSPRAWLIT